MRRLFELASPASGSYAIAGWLFLRLLAAIYFCAFFSLAVQIRGLMGRQGILPATEYLRATRALGVKRFFRVPTLCWIHCSDRFLTGLCWSGVVLSTCLAIGLAPALTLILLWVAYLSIFTVGRLFLGYQWDLLLLETGFLAIFVAPWQIAPAWPPHSSPSPIIVGLFWWLLFRLMFSSGVVKLRSHDKSWRKLTALAVHYETQPLPTPLAWVAHQLPLLFHRASAALMFLIELGGPWLILAGGSSRHVAAGLFIVLMVLIQITGNYGFFNLLAIGLTLFLFDDAFVIGLAPRLTPEFQPHTAMPLGIDAGIAIVLLFLSFDTLARLARLELRWPEPFKTVLRYLDPFRLVNSYGLFSVITPERPEIIIEGSSDGVSWIAYEFKWKPSDPNRPPRFCAPHQPRLDWQLWFAALGFAQNHPWFERFLFRLLEGSRSVLCLLKRNPFPQAPPRYVRAVLYRYWFTTVRERRQTGAWWNREKRGMYSAVLELGDAVEE